MQLIPKTDTENQYDERFAHPDCQALFEMPSFYEQVGYNPPWISYFVIADNKAVGTCSFVGKPQNGEVEIAYWTFSGHEGKGIASFACREMLKIAQKADPTVRITAKTLPEENASNTILKRNGFRYTGIVQDHEVGDTWGWEYIPG